MEDGTQIAVPAKDPATEKKMLPKLSDLSNAHVLAAFLGVGFILFVMLIVGIIMWRTQPTEDHEIIKSRFAAVTFTGILSLYVFVSILYILTQDEAGRRIFETAVTGMTPLAGAIIGYLFASKQQSPSPTVQAEDSTATAP